MKRLRVARGLNQVAFGKLLGVTKQCVSNWENDNVLPSVEMLVKIADVFGVTTDHLLGRESIATIDVSALNEEQRAHISQIVNDIKTLRSK
ncbi:MAG: helix-turn-helix transcriptional regulator [Clostridia bacterium]|nr:helix-turn-helix transcriptional regulator [Clostridia bacterium]